MIDNNFVKISEVEISPEMKKYVKQLLENPSIEIYPEYKKFYEHNFVLDNGEVYVRIDETFDPMIEILEV